MKFFKIVVFVTSLSLHESSQALADIYKMVDEAGKIYYSDCAKGDKYQKIITDRKESKKQLGLEKNLAESGNAKAQYSLGCSITNDNEQALMWFKKAAEQGLLDAQYALGEMYFRYQSVQNYKQAVEWYQKAAAEGHDGAQNSLGEMYYKGEGVSKDWVRAYAWFNLAAAQGNNFGKSNRDLYEKQLTDTERAEGQRLASNWKKGDTLSEPVVRFDQSSAELIEDKSRKQATGTAFAVSSEGHALTNHHVINGCIEVKVAGRDGVVKVITSDSVNDLALLQLPNKSVDIAKLNPEPGKLRQGEDVIVFGYPLNFVLSSGGNLTPGTLSALTGLGNNTNQIQITAPIQPGSSGSPVMDKKGNVVGVVSMKLDDGKMAKATGQLGQNVNFAVNGQTVRTFLDTNKVPYKTGGGFFSHEMDNADIADEARKWTILVECWK